MPLITRRAFVASSTSGAATLVLSSAATAKPASAKVVLALIGAGGRGVGVALDFASRKDAEVACVCDLHEERLARAVKAIATRQGKAPKTLKEGASKDGQEVPISPEQAEWLLDAFGSGRLLMSQEGERDVKRKPQDPW